MTIETGFFNSMNRDRVYDARMFAQYFSSFIGNGVFPNPSTGLQVMAGDNLNTVIKAGKAWINGYFITNDADYFLQHDNADGVLKRVDRIVIGLNYLTRTIDIYIKKGAFASNPVGPDLQRDSELYELSLADVLINNGSVQISQSNITDTRLNSNLCGIVSGVVNQIDTTTIFNQYIARLAELNDVLDENVAGNLLNMINANTNLINANTSLIESESEFKLGEVNILNVNPEINFPNGDAAQLIPRFSRRVGRKGDVRLKFTLSGTSSIVVIARVYVNGVQYSPQVQTNSFTNYTFDITGLNVGDLVEIWGQRTATTSNAIHLRNIQISVDKADVLY